jgi:hypothetical protein
VVLRTGLMDKALESPALAEVKAGVREGRWPDGEFVLVAVATNGSATSRALAGPLWLACPRLKPTPRPGGYWSGPLSAGSRRPC